MNFRDYAQGAYRMRGINRGQSVRNAAVPETAQVIPKQGRIGCHRYNDFHRTKSRERSSQDEFEGDQARFENIVFQACDTLLIKSLQSIAVTDLQRASKVDNYHNRRRSI